MIFFSRIKFFFHRIILFLLFISVFIISGYFIGTIIGNFALRNLFFSQTNFSIIFPKSKEYLNIKQKIYSNNSLERLSGYYAVDDGMLFNPSFFIKAYKQESNDVCKNTILWILVKHGKNKVVKNFLYKKINHGSSLEKAKIFNLLNLYNYALYKKIMQKCKKNIFNQSGNKPF